MKLMETDDPDSVNNATMSRDSPVNGAESRLGKSPAQRGAGDGVSEILGLRLLFRLLDDRGRRLQI